jgi:hypothetical protein
MAISSTRGELYIKWSDGNWYPATTVWTKQNGTWVPLSNIYIKNSLSQWEQVYPITTGFPLVEPRALNFSTYNNYVVGQPLQIVNTGDRAFSIDEILAEPNSVFTVGYSGATAPIIVEPQANVSLTILAGGFAVGNSTASLTLVNNLGTMGYANVTVPIITTVLPDYSGLAVSPTTFNFSYLIGNAPPSFDITITNTGNGGNLNILGVTSSLGSTIQTPSVVGFDWQTMTQQSANIVVTLPSTLSPGVYTDQISIVTDAPTNGNVTVTATANVIQPHGLKNFTTSGVYSWTVPVGVYSILGFTIGGGGGGGAGGASTYNTTAAGGGGGGSGGISATRFNVTPGEVLSIQVGAGGTPGLGGAPATPQSLVDGGDGGSSTIYGSFGSLRSTGGVGGTSAIANSNGSGGAGGTNYGVAGLDGAVSTISSSGFGLANGGAGGNTLFYVNNGAWDFISTCDTTLYQVNQIAYPAYMNDYAVWVTADETNPIGVLTTVNFTMFNINAGVYTVYAGADDQVTIYINGQLIGAVTGYATMSSYQVTLPQGYVKITCQALNFQGSAGFAVIMVDANGNEVWNTRTSMYSPALTQAIYGAGGAGGISYGYEYPYWWQGQSGSDGGVFLVW